MFPIEVNFLTGRFVATSHRDRGLPEWPPHPARLFSALVATWADSDHPDPAERNALEWIEAQDPPSIAASHAEPRRVVTHFVPVNDATVVATGLYRKRADKIDALEQDLAELRKAGGPNADRRIKTLETRITQARDITSLVSGTAKTGIDLLPERRIRQARMYPSVTPSEPRVTFIWKDKPTPAMADTIDALLGRVTRLGHSSSLVSCRISPNPPEPCYVPAQTGDILRSVRKGQLERLEYEYAQHLASRPRTLPYTAVRYAPKESASKDAQRSLRSDTAGDWIVFEFLPGSRRLPSTRTADVAAALRKSVFHYAEAPIPEGLSGHRPGGGPSSVPHVAFLPLPHVGHEHADGRLMGIAIGLPKSLDRTSRRSLLRAIGFWEKKETGTGDLSAPPPVLTLKLGPSGVLRMTRQTRVGGLVALRPDVWSQPARHWVSVTPIALPAHPGPLDQGTAHARSRAWARAEKAVNASCRHVALPEPERIAVSFDPFIRGAHPAQRFPAFRQGGVRGRGVARRLVHASVTFEESIAGPLILGAGRYGGLGLMRPLNAGGRGDG